MPAFQYSVLRGFFLSVFLLAGTTTQSVAQVASVAARTSVSDQPKVDKGWISSNLDSLEQLYRHFHQHPELSFEERETAKRYASELSAIGATVTANVGGHGVVAVIQNGSGRTLHPSTPSKVALVWLD